MFLETSFLFSLPLFFNMADDQQEVMEDVMESDPKISSESAEETIIDDDGDNVETIEEDEVTETDGNEGKMPRKKTCNDNVTTKYTLTMDE